MQARTYPGLEDEPLLHPALLLHLAAVPLHPRRPATLKYGALHPPQYNATTEIAIGYWIHGKRMNLKANKNVNLKLLKFHFFLSSFCSAGTALQVSRQFWLFREVKFKHVMAKC